MLTSAKANANGTKSPNGETKNEVNKNQSAHFHQICARNEDASDDFRAAACNLPALMTFEIARKYANCGESNAPHPIHSYAFV